MSSLRVRLYGGSLPIIGRYFDAWLASIAALVYTVILGFETGWGLFVGGDFPGYYYWLQPILDRLSISNLIYGVSLLVTGNVYAGFYLFFFVTAFITMYSILYLCKRVMRLDGFLGLVVPIAVVLFYMASPAVYLDPIRPIVRGLAGIGYIASTSLFIASLIGSYSPRERLLVALLAVIMGPLSIPYPNNFRLGAFFAVLSLLYLIASILSGRSFREGVERVLIPLSLVFVSMTVIGVYYAVSGKLGYYVVVARVYTRLHGYTSTSPFAGQTVLDTFFLASSWPRYTDLCPYCSSYLKGLDAVLYSIVIGSLLALPLVLLERCSIGSRIRRDVLVFLYVIVVAGVLYESHGLILPSLFRAIERLHLSIVYALFPPFIYWSSIALRLAYILLFGVALSCILASPGKTWAILSAVPLLIALGLAPMWPMFTGDAVAQYFNTSIKGVHIPWYYFEFREKLIRLGVRDVVLLLPPLHTYVRTSWGYQGSMRFYANFFYPVNIYVSPSYGEYVFREYYVLTTPGFTPSERIVELNISRILYWKTNNTMFIELARPYDLHNFTLLVVNTTGDVAEIGLSDGLAVGWHKLYQGNLYKLSDTSYEVLLGAPSTPRIMNWYNISHITSIMIKYQRPLAGTSIARDISIYAGNPVELSNRYRDMLIKHGIRYILVDTNIVEGAMIQSPELLVKAFTMCRDLEPVIYSYHGLYLFAIKAASSGPGERYSS